MPLLKSNRPWWWLDLPGVGQEVDDLTEDGNDWENVLSNEQFLLTERDDLELPDLLDNFLPLLSGGDFSRLDCFRCLGPLQKTARGRCKKER